MDLNKVWYVLISVVLFTLVLLETLSQTYWLNADSSREMSLVYLGAGIGIALFPLIKVQFSQGPLMGSYSWVGKINVWFISLGIIQAGYFMSYKTPWIFDHYPISVQVADMLPVMTVMCKRFLAGEAVYEVIPEIWEGMPPIYLPGMWIPYVPSFIYGFDMRWIGQGMMLIGLAFAFRFWDIKSPIPFWVFLVFIPFGLMNTHIYTTDWRLIAVTEEGIVVGYYLLLAGALMTRNPWVKGIAIALCLMSRYVLVFWLPFYLIYVFLRESRSHAYIIAGVAFTLSMGLMLWTGAFQNLSIFLDMPRVYLDAVQDPNNSWKYLSTINESLGLGKYLGIERIGWLHKGLFVFSLLSPFCFLLWILFKPHTLNTKLWALCSLKMSLVLFYQFLVINPLYLFYTSTFFSYAVLYAYWTQVSPSDQLPSFNE